MSNTAAAQAPVQLPGPVQIPLVGWRTRGLRMLGDPAEYFMRQYAHHGQVSAWKPRNPRHVFAFGPEYLKRIFTEPEVFVADSFREVRIPEQSSFYRLTNGLLRRNGDPHRRHRRLMQPAFTARRVLVHRENVADVTERCLSEWRTGDVVPMHDALARIIMLTAMRTVFDIDAPERIERLQGLISRLLRVAAAPLTLLLPYDLPGSTFRAALRTCEQIEALLLEMIRDRRADGATGRDVLTSLVNAEDEDGSRLSEAELVGEAYTAFCHDSSTATLMWTLLLLDQHPDVMNDVVDEVTSVCGGGPPDDDQLGKLPLLDAVLKETLRLLPPAPMLIRYTSRPTRFGRYELPSGAMVFFSSYVTHRLEETYRDPLRFDPGRWERESPSTYEYLPFGAGAHNCVGRHFAMLEMKTVLAVLLQKFRPALVPDSRVDRAMRVSLVPSHGLPMRLHPPGTGTSPAPLRGNIRDSVRLP
ncbi:cytochrome P450 [Streptomyces nanshensis]|uniref:Cytochrome n=1 Tax=Streptomyces nanshensis TaxID=518642 RepID=A0A1E7L245_9ACTN|nr:cytochrome P450 [Streptomyces nanshensis]OEV10264.1 cytochrome [Streptomyces nanshensis]